MAVTVHGNGHEPSLGQLQGNEILALAPVVASVQRNHAGSRILRRCCLWLVNGEADVVPQAVHDLDILGDHAAKIRIDQRCSKNGDQADNNRDQEKFRIKFPIQFHLKYLPFLCVRFYNSVFPSSGAVTITDTPSGITVTLPSGFPSSRSAISRASSMEPAGIMCKSRTISCGAEDT